MQLLIELFNVIIYWCDLGKCQEERVTETLTSLK